MAETINKRLPAPESGARTYACRVGTFADAVFVDERRGVERVSTRHAESARHFKRH